MIGDALMAYPLYGEDCETAQARNVYLPEGKWIDYDNGREYIGPLLLKDFKIPVEKTPLFVGGTGIIIEEIEAQDLLDPRRGMPACLQLVGKSLKLGRA